MKSNEIRNQFLEYFASKGHEIVASSSLVPSNDPSLLFTNAGMVQFKDVFLGNETRPYHRAASSQRCVRAGGKHNDLENVGYTTRHHTFFEMLGNFSFGDYFKRDAIIYAWEFLTDVMKIPEDRLWVTVFEEDEAAESIWLNEIGIRPERCLRIGARDNFWSMGDTGPCGPCTEIFYDHGPEIEGGPPGSSDEDSDRYVEIWNLVFMQYDRAADGSLKDLPGPSVDTGMGLERLAAVKQGVSNNYDIDLFKHLVAAAGKVTSCDVLDNKSLRVIADHIRSTSFLILDGVVPSNEGRGYVLRRIIRRAVRHGHMLGTKGAFFYKLVGPLVDEMGAAYPELAKAQATIESVLKTEEERFAETLETGMNILNQAIAEMQGDVIDGTTAFRLYDTHGFPFDLTADIARERGLTVDQQGFENEMEKQRQQARSSSQFSTAETSRIQVEGCTEFTGYIQLEGTANITAIYQDNDAVREIKEGDSAVIILDKTPFYAESGGQAGDTGQLLAGKAIFDIEDTKKLNRNIFGHIGRLRSGVLKVNSPAIVEVNAELRQETALNHSATHLMHAALKSVLGEHIEQKGSLVNSQYLRFDFSHFSPLSEGEIKQIENLVNTEIRANREVNTTVMAIDEAKAAGAVALFGEKYGDEVRVVRMGDFSMELCGGTHVSRTGDIGLFVIRSESGVAAGIRRIEALTGNAAIQYFSERIATLNKISAMVKGDNTNTEEKIHNLLDKLRGLEKENNRLNDKLASSSGNDIASTVIEVEGVPVVASVVENANADTMRKTIDQLRSKLGSVVVVLGASNGEKVSFIAGVSPDLTDRIHAGNLIRAVAEIAGGRGGGRPDMAQAGASKPEKLNEAIATVKELVAAQLQS
ncbi:MAG: alanine--tRNA ligase [Gammaproteobacteria bacterium]|nr:MAG: alanine--tRNA ligase [Gammaproteobacteria bacterium]